MPARCPQKPSRSLPFKTFRLGLKSLGLKGLGLKDLGLKGLGLKGLGFKGLGFFGVFIRLSVQAPNGT